MGFVHLHVHSPYSFLDGASPIRGLIEAARDLGMEAMALTDHVSLSGAVEFRRLAGEAGIRAIQGVEITVAAMGRTASGILGAAAHHLVLLARNPEGFANLCRILTRAHLDHPRGRPVVTRENLAGHRGGLVGLSGCRRGEIPWLLLANRLPEALEAALALAALFEPGSFFLELQGDSLPGTRRLNRLLHELAARLGIGTVAANNVHFRRPEDFPLHDLLTCVRTQTRLDQAHPERRLNAEGYFKSPAQMASLFREYPAALAAAGRIAGLCEPSLLLDQRLFPAFPAPAGESAASLLNRLVFEGARERYGKVTPEIAARLHHELSIICRLGYEDYFLLVWDVVREARRQGIRLAGRGSAADSAVAYCLWITNVDSIGRGLLFERFMSLERAQKPDIDIDFDARHRDRLVTYLEGRYGADRVASVCTYNTFQARSGLREFGKAMGFEPRELDELARRFPHLRGRETDELAARYPEVRDCGIPLERYRRLLELVRSAEGFPRFLGTHLGGVVVGREPLSGITPLQHSAKGMIITQFDKDHVEELGLIKLDLLSLRALSAMDDTVQSIRLRRDPAFELEAVPFDDPGTYAMINRAETVGVCQLESPAQRALQARLGARDIEDLIASVALIRPGPIKGNMVEPFVARRRGEEPVAYLHPKLEPILAKTYGVVLFQEQVLEIATTVAGFTPGEADRLRRVMTHARSREEMAEIGKLFTAKAVAAGIEPETAEAIFQCLAGYASYGFCEAHAAAFGDLAYRMAYLLKHHPADLYAALFNHQPMGFYPPSTLCVEARRRGVRILPPDVNRSGRDFTVEILRGRRAGIRVGLRQVKKMSEAALERILAARGDGPFTSLQDFRMRTGAGTGAGNRAGSGTRAGAGTGAVVHRGILECLVLAGAFDSLHLRRPRRALLWELGERVPGHAAGEGFFGRDEGVFPPPASGNGDTGRVANAGVDGPVAGAGTGDGERHSDFTPWERLWHEFESLGFPVSGHFMEVIRPLLKERKFQSSQEVKQSKVGAWVRTAGLVIRPHRPPTRSGKTVVFLTLEDEAGLVEVTAFDDVYQKDGAVIFGQPAVAVEGKVERRGRAVSVVARRFRPLSFLNKWWEAAAPR